MIRIPEDIAESLGSVEGEYIYYDGWKYEVITHDFGKKEYIVNPIGKMRENKNVLCYGELSKWRGDDSNTQRCWSKKENRCSS